MNEHTNQEKTSTNINNEEKRREVSKYAYPYYDLETTLEAAEILYNRAGGKASFSQLASYLGHKDESSGAFVAKVWAAKHFNLVTIEQQQVSITKLGEKLASLQSGLQRDKCLAEAFLSVPLFKEVYNKFLNSTLPTTKMGLLNALQNIFSVPSKRSAVALKVLLASAEQAGFRRADPNRLVHPIPMGLLEKDISSEKQSKQKEEAQDVSINKTSSLDTFDINIHPAIRGFLRELPENKNQWSMNEQQRWLDAFTAMVKAIYPAKPEK
jgi:hypothetical protein